MNNTGTFFRGVLVVVSAFVSASACHDVNPGGAGANGVPGQLLKAKKYITIPLIRDLAGDLIVKARVDNDTAMLMLDTGATETCLDESSAQKFGISLAQASGGAVGYGGKPKHFKMGQAVLTLDTLTIEWRDIAVIDLSNVNNANRARGDAQIDGVIGADILQKFNAIIDYGTSTLYLHD